MTNALQDDMFTPEVIADPYAYYGRLRDEDPVHWNEKYELWVVTRHDDLVWLTRHHELFSSAVFKNDPRPAYPTIDESDLGLYEYVRNYQGDQFIQHDRPDHLEMRKVVHGYFTPKSSRSGGRLCNGPSSTCSTRSRKRAGWMSCGISRPRCRCWSSPR